MNRKLIILAAFIAIVAVFGLLGFTSLGAPTTQQSAWMQAIVDSDGAKQLQLSKIVGTFPGGDAQAVPTPPKPANVTLIGPKHALTSTDDIIDPNAKENWHYQIDGPTKSTRAIYIKKSGVVIEGITKDASIDADCAKWKQSFITYDKSATGCTVQNLTIMGHDGGNFVNLQGTSDFTFEGITQREHPQHHGGITPLATDGSKNLTYRNVTMDRVARYGLWEGNGSKRGNLKGLVENSVFGPCSIKEDTKLSGQAADKNTLNGGAPYEHGGRFYGIEDYTFRDCIFRNPKGIKQAAKFMQGNNIQVINCTFDGSTRFGRDQNDPSDYTLTNLTVSGSTFTNYVRLDLGANTTFSGCELPNFQTYGGKAHVLNSTIGGVLVKDKVIK